MSKKKVKKPDAKWRRVVEDGFELPCLLSKVIDDVGTGAFLKRVQNDDKAVVVDCVLGDDEAGGNGGFVGFMAVVVSDACVRKGMDAGYVPSVPEDYELVLIENGDDWIVLHKGHDYVLVE